MEKQYGAWKRRFPILWVEMHTNVERVEQIIVAAAVLRNIAIYMNDLYPEETLENVANYHAEVGNEVVVSISLNK